VYLPLFDELAKLPVLSARSAAEIEHHRAKAFNLTGEREKAIAGFEAVLSGPFPLDAARLQLIRIYGRDKATASRAEALAADILERASIKAGEVATSVVLAAIEAVPWTTLRNQRAHLSTKYGDLIEERIIAAATAGSEQPYQTFASIGRYWAWHEQDRFMRVWTSLPRRSAEEMTRDQDRFAYGDILRQAAQRMNLPQEERDKLHQEALAIFNAIGSPTTSIETAVLSGLHWTAPVPRCQRSISVFRFTPAGSWAKSDVPNPMPRGDNWRVAEVE
jgi:hypothetical protein